MKCIIQIGSHVGDSSNDPIFNKVDENDKVILVEPVPYLFEILKENYNKKYPNNKFIFINKAVSNINSRIRLTIPSLKNNFQEYPYWASQLSSVNSEHIKNHLPTLITEDILVESTTLNKIIEEYNIEKIDLLHIDTEGHDYYIIMDYNFNIKPRQIMFEHAHMDGFLIHNQKYNKLIEHLNKLGYTIIYKDTEDTVVELK